jgi:hypothetical protein
LALLSNGKLDEACGQAVEAMGAGWIVPSNLWRVQEIAHALVERGFAGADRIST